MFRKFVEDRNDFVKKFVKFVCCEEKDSGTDYSICQTTGFQYLGEFFERYERENINPMDIIKGIACICGDLNGHQIYDGQLEYFKEKTDCLMSDNDVFLENLCYIIFLQKLGYEEESMAKLNDILEDMNFGFDFLTLTLAVYCGNLKLDESYKVKVYEVLNNCNLNLDCLSLAMECSKSESFLKKPSVLPGISVIEKTYELKSKNIKNSNKLKFLKNLKKIGTRKLEFEDVKEFVEIKEQDFYFISLKVSYEINDGLVLYRTNEHLANLIEDSINVNTKTYPYLCQIEVTTDKNAYWKKKIGLRNLDFNATEPEYYAEFVKMNQLNYSIKYDSYKELVVRKSFFEFFKNLKYDDYKKFKNKIAMEVVALNEDKSVNDFYVSNIENFDDMSIVDKFILVEKGYLDFVSFIESDLLNVNELGETEISFLLEAEHWFAPRYKVIYSGELEKYNLKNVAFSFLKYMMKHNVKVSGVNSASWIREFFIDVYFVSFENVLDLSKSEDDIKNNLELILNYIFMYDTNSYIRYVVKAYLNDSLNKYLDISEEEMKLFCEECLNSKMQDYNLMGNIKSIMFDSKEGYLYECKSRIDNFLSVDWTYSYASNNYVLDALVSSFDKGDEESKSEIRKYIKESFIKTEVTSIKNMSVRILKLLVDKNIVKKEDAMDIISSYLD